MHERDDMTSMGSPIPACGGQSCGDVEGTWPVIIRRPGKHKAFGFLACLVVSAFVTVIAGIALLIPALDVFLDTEPSATAYQCLAWFLVLGVVIFAFFFARYRRRATRQFWLWPDRLEIRSWGRVIACPWELVEEYQAADFNWIGTIRLRLKRGCLQLNSREWPVDQIRRHVEEFAVPAMVQRAQRELAAGEELLFREPKVQTAAAMARLSLITLGLLAALGGKIMAFGLWGSLDVYFIIALLGATGVFFRRYWRAIFGSGLAVTAMGLRSRADYRGQEIRWAEVSGFQVAQEGATVHSAKPFVPPLSLSSTAPNYHVFVALSAARLPQVVVEKAAAIPASSPGKA